MRFLTAPHSLPSEFGEPLNMQILSELIPVGEHGTSQQTQTSTVAVNLGNDGCSGGWGCDPPTPTPGFQN